MSLTVGALGRDGRVLPLSGRGPQVALAAPGEKVVSTAPGSGRRRSARPRSSRAPAPRWRRRSSRGRRPGSWRRGRGCPPSGCARCWRRPRATCRPEGATARAAPAPSTWPRRSPRRRRRPRIPSPTTIPARPRGRGSLLGGAAASGTVRGRTGSYDDPRDGFRVVLRAGEAVSRAAGAGGGHHRRPRPRALAARDPRGVARARVRPHLARLRVARPGRGRVDRRDGARGAASTPSRCRACAARPRTGCRSPGSVTATGRDYPGTALRVHNGGR